MFAFIAPSLPLPFRSPRPPLSVPLHCNAQHAPSRQAIVVGAGVAGLTAAKTLSAANVSVTLLEASDAVGGRVRTDLVDGYLLDRGFQVFIEGYPACRQVLDYNQLNLQPFLPGAKIRHNANFHILSDPFRAPLLAASGLFSPIGTLSDKLRVLLLRIQVMSDSIEQTLSPNNPGLLLDQFLSDLRFSPSFIAAFFKPFYQGIFLAPLNEQSASMFRFVFRMFSEAPASLPAAGIGAITAQMRQRLPSHVTLHLNSPVTNISPGYVQVADKQFDAPVVILATEGPEAVRLLDSSIGTAQSRGSICIYFSSDRPSPVDKPILVLNGDGPKDGPVNNMFVPSQVASSYAPDGKTLISTTIVGDELGQSDNALETAVRQQMSKWFGPEEVDHWVRLAIYRIPHSQPAQSPDYVFERETSLGDGLFVCGDHRNSPTLHGAIMSGRAAAENALTYLEQVEA